ncbi:hypothetical protein [Parasphingorhabdus sp. NYA22]
MVHVSVLNDEGGEVKTSVAEYKSMSVEELYALTSADVSKKRAFTARDIILDNKDKVHGCIAKGYSKTETAAIISQDPRNTAKVSAILREMNKALGPWRDLQKLNEEQVAPSNPAISRQHDIAVPGPNAPRRAFMDNSFDKGDMM